MKKIYTLSAALMLCAHLYGQGCVGSFTLTTQTQVDAFNCTSVTGNVIIESALVDPILNLDGLAGLTHVGGNLIIRNNASLTDFDGLNLLLSVGGNLLLNNNTFLLHLDDLLSIIAVGGNLTITNNLLLIDVDGLINLKNFDGNLTITNNSILTNIDGLLGISGTIGTVNIAVNPILEDILGLFGVSKISGGLTLRALPLVVDLWGLDNITMISGSVLIQQNAALDNLDHLSSLTSINGSLSIRNNGALLDISGLSNLGALGGGLLLQNNANLPDIGVDLGSLTGAINGDLSIINNDALINIDFLSGITSVNGSLVIRNNNLLFNIDGMSNITSISGSLEISNNINLVDCTGSCTVINLMGVGMLPLSISGNVGCMDAPSLETACLALPVELAYFRGEAQSDRILLYWMTFTESNNAGFELQRSENGRDYKTVHWAPGWGNSTEARNYSYTDTDVEKGTPYFYRLYQLDFDGSGAYSDWITLQIPIDQVLVEALFPNPTPSNTSFFVNSPGDEVVTIELSDVGGALLRKSVQSIAAGRQRVEVDGSDLSAGLYFLRITIGSHSFYKKLIVSIAN